MDPYQRTRLGNDTAHKPSKSPQQGNSYRLMETQEKRKKRDEKEKDAIVENYELCLLFLTALQSIAICESGVGVSPTYPNNGLVDDPYFPLYLRSRLDWSNLTVEFIMIWDTQVGDG